MEMADGGGVLRRSGGQHVKGEIQDLHRVAKLAGPFCCVASSRAILNKPQRKGRHGTRRSSFIPAAWLAGAHYFSPHDLTLFRLAAPLSETCIGLVGGMATDQIGTQLFPSRPRCPAQTAQGHHSPLHSFHPRLC
jgi:hypothetical protein